MKLIRLSDIKFYSIIEHMEAMLSKYDYQRDIQRFRVEARKTKKPLLQLYRNIKAIVVKILCNVNQFDYNTHFITENIFTQTTYYKTLTSRP